MRRIMFFFLDGVGLGKNDVERNPFATANLPTLHRLTGGQRLLDSAQRHDSGEATFIPTDAQMGVAGLPQSASGQATILTGRNIPAAIGQHYGPKPNADIRAIIKADNLFMRLRAADKPVALANAYPPSYFEATQSGRRLHGTIPMAVTAANVELFDISELRAGRAFSADWTGDGWRTQLKIDNVPLYTPTEAGQQLARVAQNYALLFFDHWPTDIIGHRGTLAEAITLLERFDSVLDGLLSQWDTDKGLVVITSDHGNIEYIGNRRHTDNRVPTLVIGSQRHVIAEGLTTLADIAAGVLQFLTNSAKTVEN